MKNRSNLLNINIPSQKTISVFDKKNIADYRIPSTEKRRNSMLLIHDVSLQGWTATT